MIRVALFFVLLLSPCLSVMVSAQSPQSTRPTVGIRDNRAALVALVGGDVVPRPGRLIESGTVLIDGNKIVSVGPEISVPDHAEVIRCEGRIVYPGLIDAYHEIDVSWDEKAGDGNHWNAHVTPRRTTRIAAGLSAGDLKSRRGQGITAHLLAPAGRIVKGRSSIRLLSGDGSIDRWSGDPNWQHVQLTVPRRRVSGESYPNSPMGATALLRQTLYDARWHDEAVRAFTANRGLPRPENNADLSELAGAMETATFVVDAPNERMAIRAGDVADEFSLSVILRGSGREYRSLAEITKLNRPLLVPVDFADAPSVAVPSLAREVTLQTLLHWHHGPTNPALINEAGLPFCLTTDGLDDVDDFLPNVRRAIDRGLPADDALAALTTTPAKLLGISEDTGTIEAGKLANLFITDRPWTDEAAKVTDTFVAGKRFRIVTDDAARNDPLIGRWQTTLHVDDKPVTFPLVVRVKKKKLAATIEPNRDDKTPRVPILGIVRNRNRLSGTIDQAEFSEALGLDLPDGAASIELLTVPSESAGLSVSGDWITAAGERIVATLEPADDEPETDDPETDESADSDAATIESASIPLVQPLGAYGVERTDGVDTAPRQPAGVLFRGATVWTCGPEGNVVADVLVVAGKIHSIGKDLDVPDGTEIVDAAGKHVSPGIIDCHSHMATDGGVNESGQAVTAEVRIGDFLDNTDITIYRHLAGGMTTSNILHGSANPIGGQNQVIKLRWGGTMDDLRFDGAPAGIKFALGENVKRNTSRYPNTRMGVEQIIRDQLLAAREYDAKRRAYENGDHSTLPVRRDLQLDALAEIQRGERWIHCHSYRQDEILATLSVLEEFGIRIGTLQHILEGYKVADAMAKHGAMGSSFSDWWAYKFEVIDAIPYNGVLMHDAGVVVSYNSDDRELGRHLNTEAAKATKYGGVPPQEALKFVTLNPARQLRIDDRVGSIEVGKDADLVIWSGPPMSTTSRCEQTWVDGRCYFSLENDAALRSRDRSLRRRLIQLVLSENLSKEKGDKDEDGKEAKDDVRRQAEEDRWLRFDEFCTTKQRR